MDSKIFGHFIAGIRKEKNMTQAELADKIGVTDKAISRWERGIGFPDINTLEPLAKALDITILELMNSQKSDAESETTQESQIIEIMNKAVEISKENQRQERVTNWLSGGVVVIVAILVKMFSASSIGGALLVGGFVSLVIISLYLYARNYSDKHSRIVYGSFMLLGTLLSVVLFQIAGMEPDKILWLVYGVFFFSVISTYK